MGWTRWDKSKNAPNWGRKLDRFLFGGGPAKALVPPDMAGMRAQQIQLLMSLLSPGAFGPGGAGQNFFGAENFPTGPSPETSVFNTARPVLEGMLSGGGPQFERDIAMANATGGRFSSGNAIMRGEALRNLFNARTQTAQTLGVLGGQAGTSQANQRNQLLQLLAGLLGMSGQATLSAPVQAPNKGAFGDILSIFAALVSGGKGGGGGGAAAPAGPTFSPAPNPYFGN